MLDQLKKAEEVAQDMVNSMLSPVNIADDEMMVPVDFRCPALDFDDPKGAAEAFAKAKEYFDDNKEGKPEEQRPKPMTAAEWKQTMEEGDDEDEEEELRTSTFEMPDFFIRHYLAPAAEYRHHFKSHCQSCDFDGSNMKEERNVYSDHKIPSKQIL